MIYLHSYLRHRFHLTSRGCLHQRSGSGALACGATLLNRLHQRLCGRLWRLLALLSDQALELLAALLNSGSINLGVW